MPQKQMQTASFAPHRDADKAIVWFFFALPAFMILHAICVKLGAI
jgi:hypothetical protein